MKKENTKLETKGTANQPVGEKNLPAVDLIKKEVSDKNINACTKEEKALYRKLTGNIDKALEGIDNQFIKIACAVWEINKKSLFRAGMYKNISDCVADLFQMKKSASYAYIGIVDYFCDIDENEHPIGLSEKWKDFSVSKLTAMLSSPVELLEGDNFTPDMTVKQIKDYISRAKELTILDAVEEETSGEQLSVDDMNPPEEELLEEIDISPDDNSTFIGQFADLSELDKLRDSLSDTLNFFKSDKKFTGKKFHYEINLVWE